ncbi:MAG: alpha-amylase family glycosyl hydrolase [Candidatus Neomarinimicrobiota bacterium]
MKHFKYLFFSIFFLFILSSCSDTAVSDPPVLTDKWITVYDTESEGISKSWINNFPTSNFAGSSWENWQIPNAPYRWHKQNFMVGTLDSTAHYYLSCSTIASPSLIWLNGKFLDKLDHSESYSLNITDHLIENEQNELIIRNEYQENSFGIHCLNIEKNTALSALATKKINYYDMPLYNEPPSYAHDMIIYEAYIRQMTGGQFSGLQNLSSRLQQLGINMLRLLPIHPTTRQKINTSYADPYVVYDYFSTSAELGSMTQFSSLRSFLHRNKIKLMLDAPIAFSATDHSWTKDYPDYYLKNAAGKYQADPEHRYTAMFNLENPQLQARLFSYFDFWIEQGVDAFRIDGSENMSKEVFETFHEHFSDKRERPFLMADGTKPEHVLYGLDAVDGDALYSAFLAIKNNKANANIIGETLEKELKSYPAGTKIVHYAERHDKGRAWKTLGVDDHHLALFTIFTAPGIPSILCGQELQDPPEFSLTKLKDINWYRIHWSTYHLISKLSKLRKDSPILTRGNFHRIPTSESIAGFSRRYKNETWYILMNYSNSSKTYNIDAKSTVFSDGTSQIVSEGKVKIKAKGYCIVK